MHNKIRHITNNSNLRNTVISIIVMIIDTIKFQNMEVVAFELGHKKE